MNDHLEQYPALNWLPIARWTTITINHASHFWNITPASSLCQDQVPLLTPHVGLCVKVFINFCTTRLLLFWLAHFLHNLRILLPWMPIVSTDGVREALPGRSWCLNSMHLTIKKAVILSPKVRLPYLSIPTDQDFITHQHCWGSQETWWWGCWWWRRWRRCTLLKIVLQKFNIPLLLGKRYSFINGYL